LLKTMSVLYSNTIIPINGLTIQNNLKTCYGKVLGGGSSTSGASGTIILTSLASGSSGVSYSATTGLFTILTTGTYELQCLFTISAASTGFISILVNGTNIDGAQGRLSQNGGSGSGQFIGSNLVPLTAGQTVGLQYSLTTGNGTIAGNPQDTWWSIRKVA
jgi:hypothetical protein